MKTKHGRNLAQIQRDLDCSEEELSSSFVKNNMQYMTLPDEEHWRLPLLFNLLEIRNDEMELPQFEKAEINHMIQEICISWTSILLFL